MIATNVAAPAPATLLIVDDEAAHMTALCHTLRERGFITAGFTSAAEALAALRDQEFDLLLTDLMMPGVDGIELLRAAQEIRPLLVGVLMTGHGTIDTAVEAMKVGALDYVLKPFKLSAVLPVLARALAVRQLRLANAALEASVRERTAELEAANLELASEVRVRQVAEEDVRRRNDELKGFAYTVSHDLKAPLRGISGYAQEIERRHQEGLPDRAKFCITQIITAALNLDHLIDDLLRYARLDAETPTASDVNLDDLVTSLLRDRGHMIAELGVEASVAIQPGALRVWGRGLRQVLSNLIDNAIKYSRDSKPPKLSIRSESSSEGLTLSVSDNGIGFDMKYHDRIFGLFNRLVRSSEFEGTGAGLAIVKKVVEKLGGTVRAQSAPGQGATFIVELPKPRGEGTEP